MRLERSRTSAGVLLPHRGPGTGLGEPALDRGRALASGDRNQAKTVKDVPGQNVKHVVGLDISGAKGRWASPDAFGRAKFPAKRSLDGPPSRVKSNRRCWPPARLRRCAPRATFCSLPDEITFSSYAPERIATREEAKYSAVDCGFPSPERCRCDLQRASAVPGYTCRSAMCRVVAGFQSRRAGNLP